MPDRETMEALAATYLEVQGRLYPDLVRMGLVPEKSKAAVELLAKDFMNRFLRNEVPVQRLATQSRHWKAIAACYLRFSCDKSNPRSLVQQLKLALERAHANGHFIAWQFVFADAAVSGTTADRHGYELANCALNDPNCQARVLYIDEIGRASRDAIEALRLGRMIELQGKRLIGVSDGFDSDHAMSKLMLSIYAALQEWFVDQLRSKVKRGMGDAHYRGTNLRPPAIGYKLVPAFDKDGNAVLGKDGIQANVLVIDEETRQYVEMAFDLYVGKNWSLGKIARHFNSLGVIGDSWDGSKMRQLLGRHKYVGMDVEGMTSRAVEVDEKGKKRFVVKRNPRNLWKVRRARHLQIILWKVWKLAQRRLAKSREAYAKKKERFVTRNEVNPTTLVRPLCGGCGKPMWLGRAGKYASFTCAIGGNRRCLGHGDRGSNHRPFGLAAGSYHRQFVRDGCRRLHGDGQAVWQATLLGS